MSETPHVGEDCAGVTDPQSVPPAITPPLLGSAGVPLPGEAGVPGFWGVWASIGLGLALLFTHIIAQSAGVVPFLFVSVIKGESFDVDSLGTNGFIIAVATLFATPVSVALAILLAKVRVRSWRGALVSLGFRAFGFKSVIWALLSLGGILLLWMGYAWLMKIPDVPEVMVEMYRTAGFQPVFWLALVVAAPLVEEVIFRGFFYVGLKGARFGVIWAILVPSILWAAVHLQYGIKEIGFIFLFGLALGALRWKTDSLWPPILVHALSNLISTVEVSILAAGP